MFFVCVQRRIWVSMHLRTVKVYVSRLGSVVNLRTGVGCTLLVSPNFLVGGNALHLGGCERVQGGVGECLGTGMDGIG